jgi:hypothetical protein
METHNDVIGFVNQCKTNRTNYIQSDVNSREFTNAVKNTFKACTNIGISQIFPNVLYDQVILAYMTYNKQNEMLNILKGVKFIDNNVFW